MRLAITDANRWPLAIITVLVAQVGFGVWMARVANADPHFAVEPDYYARAVQWDSTMAQARADKALGWQAGATLRREHGTVASLHVTLTDAQGQPVQADTVTATALSVAHAGIIDTLTLTREGTGYMAPVARAERGVWEVELRATRGRDVFTAKLRPELE